MRIAYVTEQDVGRPGGARSHVTGFIRAAENLGHEIRLLADASKGSLRRSGGFPGITPEKVKRLLRLREISRDLLEVLQSGWPDLVYFRAGYFNPGFSHCLRNPEDTPVVMEVNGVWWEESPDLARRILASFNAERQLSGATRVVAVSEGIKKALLERYSTLQEGRVIVVPNGVDTQLFSRKPRAEARAALGWSSGLTHFLFVGRISEWHGLDYALRAFSSLPEDLRTRARFWVVGDGPEHQSLADLADSLGVEDLVQFLGLRPQEEIPTFIAASHACIATSRQGRNDSPLKLFEYLAMGKRVIASDLPGIREAVDSVGGRELVRLVSPGDIEEISTALVEVINGSRVDEAADTRGAGERILPRVSWEARVEKALGGL